MMMMMMIVGNRVVRLRHFVKRRNLKSPDELGARVRDYAHQFRAHRSKKIQYQYRCHRHGNHPQKIVHHCQKIESGVHHIRLNRPSRGEVMMMMTNDRVDM